MEWYESACVYHDLSAPVIDCSLFDLDEFEVVQSLIRPKVMDFLNRALEIESEKLQLDQVEVQIVLEAT